FPYGFLEHRVADFSSNVSQRFQHKTTPLHGGMRNSQPYSPHLSVAEENDVNIQNAGGLRFVLAAAASHGLLHSQSTSQELFWHQGSFQVHSAVQEPGLRALYFHGLSFVKRRNCRNGSQLTQAPQAFTQVSRAVAQVRPQRKIDGLLHRFTFTPAAILPAKSAL